MRRIVTNYFYFWVRFYDNSRILFIFISVLDETFFILNQSFEANDKVNRADNFSRADILDRSPYSLSISRFVCQLLALVIDDRESETLIHVTWNTS